MKLKKKKQSSSPKFAGYGFNWDAMRSFMGANLIYLYDLIMIMRLDEEIAI